MSTKSPVEMYNEMVRIGLITPAVTEPSAHMAPSAYISGPSMLAFATPPIAKPVEATDAKLESRTKRNSKRSRQSR